MVNQIEWAITDLTDNKLPQHVDPGPQNTSHPSLNGAQLCIFQNEKK